MENYGADKFFLKTLSVLYIEDDESVIEQIALRLDKSFSETAYARSAEEALILLENRHFDLVMTDYFLPKMNGMEFIKIIKEKTPDIPVILITAYVDMGMLVEAINMGVTQFVSKPIRYTLLQQAIARAVDRVVIANLEKKTREQELELFKYRNDYDETQQELAFRKELNIIRNDVQNTLYIPDGFSESNCWTVDVHYESKDVVSGDSYSCRKLPDGSLLLFLADAMGKGVSASLTSILSVAFINYFIRIWKNDDAFDMDKLIVNFALFVKDNLMDEEILCASIVHLDFHKSKMRYASFAMPRICVEFMSGEVIRLDTNNLPIMKHLSQTNISELPLDDVAKMLISSDGLIESYTHDGTLYSEEVEKDFRASPLLREFKSKIHKKVDLFEDDLTILFIRRLMTTVVYSNIIKTECKFDNLSVLGDFLIDEMANTDAPFETCSWFLTAYTEAIMNAYEHGGLGITLREKEELIKNDAYDAELRRREQQTNKHITSRFILCKRNEHRYAIVSVRDEGNGYPESFVKNINENDTQFCGRGLNMIKSYTDAFFFSADRREIFLLKLM